MFEKEVSCTFDWMKQLVCCIALTLLSCTVVLGQTFVLGFSRNVVTEALTNPTTLACAPDGRIFVCEQAGTLRVVKDGILMSTPFISLTVDSQGERGLLGIAFDPQFTTNQYVYIYYTATTPTVHNRIIRVTANGDVAVPGSEIAVLELQNLGSTTHNGGALAFGHDGKLLVSVGENASAASAQDINSYRGKILRINPDGSAPTDNPFPDPGGSEPRKRTLHLGVRNPYTTAVDRVSGRFFINDVGQSTREEINDASIGGKNFGWPTEEGPGPDPNLIDPFYHYGRGNGDGIGCAITGGTFFSPTVTNYPSAYFGKYFFLDFCGDWINLIDPAVASPTRSPFGSAIGGSPVGIIVGIDGNLYYLSRDNGGLYKIVYNNLSPPFITTQPTSVTVEPGQAFTLTAESIGTMPLSYQWQRNGQNISNATGTTYSVSSAGAEHAGTYKLIISNPAGIAVTSEVVVDIPGAVVGMENSSDIAFFPNPASGEFCIKVPSPDSQQINVMLNDGLSRFVNQQRFSLKKGENVITVDVSGMPSGFYFFSFEIGGKHFVKKLFVR